MRSLASDVDFGRPGGIKSQIKMKQITDIKNAASWLMLVRIGEKQYKTQHMPGSSSWELRKQVGFFRFRSEDVPLADGLQQPTALETSALETSALFALSNTVMTRNKEMKIKETRRAIH